eukprot:6866602-Pyramimonas_sp.AAC.2
MRARRSRASQWPPEASGSDAADVLTHCPCDLGQEWPGPARSAVARPVPGGALRLPGPAMQWGGRAAQAGANPGSFQRRGRGRERADGRVGQKEEASHGGAHKELACVYFSDRSERAQ